MKELAEIPSVPHFELDLSMDEPTEVVEFPKTWTIITALSAVVNMAHNSGLSEKFWTDVKEPLDFLTEAFGMTKMQVIVIAILVETGEAMTWRGLGRFLHCNRITIMTYSDEIEALLKKRWVQHKNVREGGARFQGITLQYGVVTALRHNKVYEPENIEGLDIQKFVTKLELFIRKHFEPDENFEDVEDWFYMMCHANKHLPICQKALEYEEDIHCLSLMMMIVVDYAKFAGTNDEGFSLSLVEMAYEEAFEINDFSTELLDGSHTLIMDGVIEYKCVDGMADNTKYVLTRWFKEKYLQGYKPNTAKPNNYHKLYQNVKPYQSIHEKEMYYNATEQAQIEQLRSFLLQDNFAQIQERLAAKGLRKGFACLFYGAPGTGKTETVLQLARQTGRDIMLVDIAEMRDKYVGESEKNIRGVFQTYRRICQDQDVMPILFFNEADAIINKRTEKIEHSVDKMDNSMQNIILQEMEMLDGILIATTNFTSTLDKAFERRFLYKVEFRKPNTEIKAKLWGSMLDDLTEDEAQQLANRYDFSGGQIENIARKRMINFILTGKQDSIDVIDTYCRQEMLDSRRTIGFLS